MILIKEKEALQNQITGKMNIIASLAKTQQISNREIRAQEELEWIIMEETRKRTLLEEQIDGFRQTADVEKQAARKIVAEMAIKEKEFNEQQIVFEERKRQMQKFKAMEREWDYKVDAYKVAVLKLERKVEDNNLVIQDVTAQLKVLAKSEGALREENEQMQKRLRELIEANREVSASYQAIRKNNDLRKSEFDQLAAELEEAKESSYKAIQERRKYQIDFLNATKTRSEAGDKIKILEEAIIKKDGDINDLLTKINDTINEYEGKLSKKEKQMFDLTLQMNDNSVQRKATSGNNQSSIDADFVADLEKKFKDKERHMNNEISVLNDSIKMGERTISGLQKAINELKDRQYSPRMERLKRIEIDIGKHVEEYALSEEMMETGFICPRDLEFFKIPVTLIPCGHTYCRDCVEALKEENYNSVRCNVCNVTAKSYYRNEQLESIAEHFLSKRELTRSFLEWLKVIRSTSEADKD